VIWNDAVQVGAITVPAEDPLASRLTRAITSGMPLTRVLLGVGVRFVVVDSTAGGARAQASGYAYQGRLPGSRVVLARPGLVVYELL
jgi:hypothetical protein